MDTSKLPALVFLQGAINSTQSSLIIYYSSFISRWNPIHEQWTPSSLIIYNLWFRWNSGAVWREPKSGIRYFRLDPKGGHCRWNWGEFLIWTIKVFEIWRWNRGEQQLTIKIFETMRKSTILDLITRSSFKVVSLSMLSKLVASGNSIAAIFSSTRSLPNFFHVNEIQSYFVLLKILCCRDHGINGIRDIHKLCVNLDVPVLHVLGQVKRSEI